MTVTSLKFKNNEYKQIQTMAKLYRVSTSEFIKQTVLDRINDERDYNLAIDNIKESHGKTSKRKEVLRRLNLL